MAPILFIVPGIYEGQAPFDLLVTALRARGFSQFRRPKLVSTGTSSKPGPTLTMADDTASLARELSEAVEAAGDEGVVAVLHSAGGFLGSGAMKGLTAKERLADGKVGGVRKIVFLAAGMLPEGFEHKPLPLMVFDHDKGIQTVTDPRNNFFEHLPDDEAEAWVASLQPQPSEWDGIITHCGWRDVPSVYVLAEKDKLVSAEMQEKFAVLAGSKLVRLDAGHLCQMAKPDEVASIIAEAARDL